MDDAEQKDIARRKKDRKDKRLAKVTNWSHLTDQQQRRMIELDDQSWYIENATFDDKDNVILYGGDTLCVYFNDQDQIHREDGPAICYNEDHDLQTTWGLSGWYWMNICCDDFNLWLEKANISEAEETWLMLKYY